MESHLLQMRGLKQNFDDARKMVTQSHLLQMRGLKPRKPGMSVEGKGRIFYRCVD